MNFQSLQTPIKSISGDETRKIMASAEHSLYQLVDVRQPGEYKQGHIPGALLIPLGELPARFSEIDLNRKAIVYCRSGVRSQTACSILTRLGCERIYNMEGGIIAYDGEQAEGNVDSGLEYFINSDFNSAYDLVMQMEAGLKFFYVTLAERAVEDEKQLLLNMARFEDGHMHKLCQQFGKKASDSELNVMEGGLDQEQMLVYFGAQLNSRENILQLGMKLEAQAFDFYCRLARRHRGEETESFFLKMADDEQQHLLKLSRELDNLL